MPSGEVGGKSPGPSVRAEVDRGRILKESTSMNLPFEKEKWPNKTNFPRNTEVKPSNKNKNYKIKKFLNVI